MSSARTDNSYFETKVKLRQDNLPKGRCRVLDCFGGTGRIWDTIRRRNPKKKIKVLRIERERGKGGVYLLGDNSKFLQSLNPDQFDVIDLDSYGVPYKQLNWLFEAAHGRPTTIFVTFIQSIYGCLPTGFLADLGYSRTMVRKCPALFNRNGLEKLKLYLADKGVKEIKHYSDHSGQKHYLYFQIGK